MDAALVNFASYLFALVMNVVESEPNVKPGRLYCEFTHLLPCKTKKPVIINVGVIYFHSNTLT